MSAFSSTELDKLRADFEEDGYLVFKGIVPKDQLSELRARVIDEFDRSKRSGQLLNGGGTITGHLNCFPGAEARFAYEALREQGMLDVIGAVYRKPFHPNHVGCNLNLPKSATQHYHIDGVYLQDFMIANVAVVDTDLVNGAIDLVAGSHRQFYPYWQFSLGRLERRSRRIQMQQGDVLIRTSRLWHRGMPNRSPVPRPMFAVTFAAGESAIPDPFSANNGKITFYENWYKANLVGRMTERTFVAAPFTYNALRFVRSIFTNKGYAA
jgi:hypothetical protein